MNLQRYLLPLALLASACSDSSPSIGPAGENPADQVADQVTTLSDDEAFLRANAQRDSVAVLPSGLQYEVLTSSDGLQPGASATITMHYVGTLIDGTEFDSSRARGEPATFGVSRLISGVSEGLQLMSVGSRYQFVIPSDLGYGAMGSPPNIGPDATLVFDIELLEING